MGWVESLSSIAKEAVRLESRGPGRINGLGLVLLAVLVFTFSAVGWLDLLVKLVRPEATLGGISALTGVLIFVAMLILCLFLLMVDDYLRRK